jgi:hypothetical protein
MPPPSLGHRGGMTVTADWRDSLDGLPLHSRLKALVAYELAFDRAEGQPVEVTGAALRAVARAEGLDEGEPWIEAAAASISARRGTH